MRSQQIVFFRFIESNHAKIFTSRAISTLSQVNIHSRYFIILQVYMTDKTKFIRVSFMILSKNNCS